MAGVGAFRIGDATVGELSQSTKDRLEDAKILFQQDRFVASMTMAIYAVEIRLKQRICEHLGLANLPTVFQIHDLESLLIVSGLKGRLEDRNNPGAVLVRGNWTQIVSRADKLNDLRYKPYNGTRQDAESLLNQLADPASGVLAWIDQQP